ncbi:MAG: hypothetical protein HY301_01020 [Verrucomicrobia bacterium]|nr:hypothetical protein [Verrucomicrobiota bacterium]
MRRIRDAHARKFNHDFDAIAQDWMKLEPWEERKTVTLRGGRIVPAFPSRKTARTRA